MRLVQNTGLPVTVATVKRMLTGFRSLGIDTDAVLAPFGLTTPDVTDVEEPVQLPVVYDLWESALKVSGESGLGVRLAMRTGPEAYGVFGGILRSSATLGDALLRSMRFHRLVSVFGRLSLIVEDDQATLALIPAHPQSMHRESVEFVLAVIGTFARAITGEALVPAEVLFSHPAPPDTRHHEAHFRAPLRFERPHNAYIFDSALLHLPVVGIDLAERESVEHEAERMLEKLPQTGGLSRRVLAVLGSELLGGNPTANHIATRLGMHPKTLARRLKNEGLTHQRLLDQLRHQLAGRYLQEPELTLSEIASRLGFADATALNRAFKRWAGCSPTEYRERHVREMGKG